MHQGKKVPTFLCRPIICQWCIAGIIFSVQTTILVEKGPFWQNRDQIGTKNGQMVPIGTLPKNRDRLVSTAGSISKLVTISQQESVKQLGFHPAGSEQIHEFSTRSLTTYLVYLIQNVFASPGSPAPKCITVCTTMEQNKSQSVESFSKIYYG